MGRSNKRRVGLAAVALAIAMLPLTNLGASAATTTVVSLVDKDTYASSSNNTPHGNWDTLGISGTSGDRRTFLSFPINKPSPTSVLTRAYLWLSASVGGSDVEVYRTGNFEEGTLIYSNMPAQGTLIGLGGAFKGTTSTSSLADVYSIDLGTGLDVSGSRTNIMLRTLGSYAEFRSKENTQGGRAALIMYFDTSTLSSTTSAPTTVASTTSTTATSTTKATLATTTTAPSTTTTTAGQTANCANVPSTTGWALDSANSTEFSDSTLPSILVKNPDGSPNRQQGTYLNSNITVSNGLLHIRSALDSGKYTSGEVQTQKVYGPGRIDVCAKLPASQKGQWPAIWMTNSTSWGSCSGSTKSGELDLVEWWWDEDGASTINRNQATTWGCVGSSFKHKSDEKWLPYDLTKDFHLWTMVWNGSSVTYLLDGVVSGYQTASSMGMTTSDFSNEMNQNWKLRLETQIVGSNGNYGWSLPDSTFKPVSFDIDYFRYYKKK